MEWFPAGNSFPQSISPCAMRNQLFIITGVFFCASLILLSSFWERLARAIARSYSRALSKRFSSSPPWHCTMLQAGRSVVSGAWLQTSSLLLDPSELPKPRQRMPQPCTNADFCPVSGGQPVCPPENKIIWGSLCRHQRVRPSPVFKLSSLCSIGFKTEVCLFFFFFQNQIKPGCPHQFESHFLLQRNQIHNQLF